MECGRSTKKQILFILTFFQCQLFSDWPLIYLNVMTALLIGQPITKEVNGSRVTSETSEMQVDNHTSDKGT